MLIHQVSFGFIGEVCYPYILPLETWDHLHFPTGTHCNINVMSVGTET